MKRSTTPSCLSRARSLASDLTEPQSDDQEDEDAARSRPPRLGGDGDSAEEESMPRVFLPVVCGSVQNGNLVPALDGLRP
jgi:hypothetical protein